MNPPINDGAQYAKYLGHNHFGNGFVPVLIDKNDIASSTAIGYGVLPNGERASAVELTFKDGSVEQFFEA